MMEGLTEEHREVAERCTRNIQRSIALRGPLVATADVAGSIFTSESSLESDTQDLDISA